MPLDTLPTRKPTAPGQLLIGGAWRDAVDGATMTTPDPTTAAAITHVAKASAVDADAAPLGGFRMSGYGREQGAEALGSYTQYKTVWANVGVA